MAEERQKEALDPQHFTELCKRHGNYLRTCRMITAGVAVAIGAIITAVKNQPVTPEEAAVFLAISIPTSLEIARLLNFGRKKLMDEDHPNQLEIDRFYREHPTIDTLEICQQYGLEPVYSDEPANEEPVLLELASPQTVDE